MVRSQELRYTLRGIAEELAPFHPWLLHQLLRDFHLLDYGSQTRSCSRMRNVGVWCMMAQDYHRLSTGSMVARFLLMKEGIKDHVITPVEESVVVEKGCNEACGVDGF